MKNRYCHRTKLSEVQFIWIAGGFCAGATATQIFKLIKEHPGKVKPVSRQTIERLYLQLRKWSYLRYVRPSILSSARRLSPPEHTRPKSDAEIEKIALKTVWLHLHGKLDYKRYRQIGYFYPCPDPVTKHLQERWRRLNGFPQETLAAHLGYATLAHAFIDGKNKTEATNRILALLEQNPL